MSKEVPTSGQPVSTDRSSGEKYDLHISELGKVVGSLANVLAKLSESHNIGTMFNGGGSGGIPMSDNVGFSQGNPAIPKC